VPGQLGGELEVDLRDGQDEKHGYAVITLTQCRANPNYQADDEAAANSKSSSFS
jgi:hypothetical protein